MDNHFKLFNLSFGPKGPIVDDSISRFTYALDKLTYDVKEGEINPLFCIAAGNDGELEDPLNRIQSPSDMVNGLGVGAYSFSTNGDLIRAPYSCIGSGREGAKTKPDFLEFGGSLERPFVLIDLEAGTLSANWGTSFASPLAIGKIGRLLAKSENIQPHIGRTLLIHNTKTDKEHSRNEQGYGFCPENIDDILNCEDKIVTILYSGMLKPTRMAKLPIFAPKINKIGGCVKISWTVTTIVDPYANDPDAYTNNCIVDTFYPHELTFNFSKRNSKPYKLNLLNKEHWLKAEELLDEGYQRSDLPVSSAGQYKNETDLRNIDLKWDTVIKKQKSMRGSSLLNPFLTLHAIGRNGYIDKPLKYFVAVTIDAPKYGGSLYDEILQTYRNLAPIEIRNINKVMVKVQLPDKP